MSMRTTVTLDGDVVAEVERLRREEGLGLSEAINMLARRGLATKTPSKPYRIKARPTGLKVDIANIGRVLEMLDEEDGKIRSW